MDMCRNNTHKDSQLSGRVFYKDTTFPLHNMELYYNNIEIRIQIMNQFFIIILVALCFIYLNS